MELLDLLASSYTQKRKKFYYCLKSKPLREVRDYARKYPVKDESKIDAYTRDAHDFLCQVIDRVVFTQRQQYGASPDFLELHPNVFKLMWLAQNFNTLLDVVFIEYGKGIFESGHLENATFPVVAARKDVLISYGFVEVKVGELTKWFIDGD